MEAEELGLTVIRLNNGKRFVSYNGQECPLIKRTKVLCEENTSYYGCVLSSVETYATPVGIVERRYESWGGGLEHAQTKWSLVMVEELKEIQERFLAAKKEFFDARREFFDAEEELKKAQPK